MYETLAVERLYIVYSKAALMLIYKWVSTSLKHVLDDHQNILKT